MGNEVIRPDTGPIMIDLTSIAPLLVDLPPGDLRRLPRGQSERMTCSRSSWRAFPSQARRTRFVGRVS